MKRLFLVTVDGEFGPEEHLCWTTEDRDYVTDKARAMGFDYSVKVEIL
jgi:hypothetical protein